MAVTRGGNDAVIVTEDFDIVKAAQLAAQATFTHSGQMCHATKRIYVQDSVYDSFLHHFRSVVSSYELGEGFLSPIQNRMQYDKVRSIYTDCEVNNYEFVLGDAKIPEPLPGTGYFVAPAIIARPPETSRIAQEEPFGPTVPVFSFSSDEDVIARANNTETGLGATLYCRNKTRAWKIASALETGGVWVNGGLKMHPEALFGAHKQSGIGGELGPLGLKFYTNTRTVTFWKSATPDAATDLFA
jgi:acyl-CoA reductase-like NAD-dependent aldehyde dehydrogenase